MGGTAASIHVVGGTIPRSGEMGGTAAFMGQMGYPYRVLVKHVHEETQIILLGNIKFGLYETGC